MIDDQSEFQQSYYDRHYPKREAAVRDQLAHPLFCSLYDRLAGRLLAQAPPVATDGAVRVYEAGCGEGFLAAAFQRVAADKGVTVAYSGSDLSAAALDLAKPYATGELSVGDATDVTATLPSSSQDLVVVKNLLHHLEDPARLLTEAARVVGPDGRVAVVEARLGAPQFWIFCFLAPRRERYFFRGAQRNRKALEAAGLRIVHAERYSWLPYELLFHIRPSWFRRLFSTDKARSIKRVSTIDDRLTDWVPWLASYVVWIAQPNGAALDVTEGSTAGASG